MLCTHRHCHCTASDSDCSTTHAAAWPDRAPIMAILLHPSPVAGRPAGVELLHIYGPEYICNREAGRRRRTILHYAQIAVSVFVGRACMHTDPI